MEGIVLENGWELQLLSTGSRRQFDTNAIIERYDTRIAMTVLADFVLLGHQNVGSFALSSDKTRLFSMALGAYLDIICEVLNNKAIPQLIDMNSDHFTGITDYPKLCHGDIESQDLVALSTYIKDLTGIGVITPDDGLEDYLREQASLPERVEDDGLRGSAQRPRNRAGESRVSPEEATMDDEDDANAIEEAKKRLGR